MRGQCATRPNEGFKRDRFLRPSPIVEYEVGTVEVTASRLVHDVLGERMAKVVADNGAQQPRLWRVRGRHRARGGAGGGGHQCHRGPGGAYRRDHQNAACAAAGPVFAHPVVVAGARGPGRRGRGRITIPWFALGFVAVVLLHPGLPQPLVRLGVLLDRELPAGNALVSVVVTLRCGTGFNALALPHRAV